MTPTEIVNAVAAFERAAGLRIEGYVFVVCSAWRDQWRLVVHMHKGQEVFDAGHPEEAFDAAQKWLESYKPTEERLAEVLGLHLLAAE